MHHSYGKELWSNWHRAQRMIQLLFPLKSGRFQVAFIIWMGLNLATYALMRVSNWPVLIADLSWVLCFRACSFYGSVVATKILVANQFKCPCDASHVPWTIWSEHGHDFLCGHTYCGLHVVALCSKDVYFCRVRCFTKCWHARKCQHRQFDAPTRMPEIYTFRRQLDKPLRISASSVQAWNGVWEMNLWCAKTLVRAWVAHVQSLTRVTTSIGRVVSLVSIKRTPFFSARKNECSSWHAPPGADAFLVSQYASCDTFCVVRDPLMRFISQYHWHYLYWKPEVSLPPNVSICGNNSASLFEQYTNETLPQLRLNPWMFDCHHALQVDYIWSPDMKTKYCDHILHFENLSEEFNDLMQEYKFDSIRFKSSSGHSQCNVSVPRHVREQLLEIYYLDYKWLNYSHWAEWSLHWRCAAGHPRIFRKTYAGKVQFRCFTAQSLPKYAEKVTTSLAKIKHPWTS